MSEVLIQVESVSKKYCRTLKRSLWYGLQDMTGEALGRLGSHDRLRRDEFWAVNDVSFELRRGECLGLIGHNGAGKTTLLKMLNGLIKPDHGRITMRGRVGALIALGAGFNPILTGRENIYVNGSVLGLSKAEIDSRVDEIIEFSGIGEFIDTPVRNYSSGMAVRLGFAVASSLDPEILLLDEVLAVGDVGFRFKCANRIRSIMRSAAVVFVSHSMEAVSQLCNAGILMHHGSVAQQGSIHDAIAGYFRLSETASRGQVGQSVLHPSVEDAQLQLPRSIRSGDMLEFDLSIRREIAATKADILVTWLNQELVPVAFYTSRNDGRSFPLRAGSDTARIRTGRVWLRPGRYRVDVSLHEAIENQYLFRSYGEHSLEVIGSLNGFAPYIVPPPE